MSCTCPEEVKPIGVLDFKLPIGSDYSVPLTWGPIDDPEDLLNFTGYSSEFVIHQNNELGPEVASLTVGNGGITISGTTITANFDETNVGHLRFVPHAYFWRVVSPAPASVRTTLLKGTITPIRA
jgi:hypothetical protein